MFDQYVARRYRTDNRPDPEAYLIKDKTAVVGIGQTDFSKNSGRSTLQLTCEAIKNAVEDAGLKMSDIDGISKYTQDPNDEHCLVDALGIESVPQLLLLDPQGRVRFKGRGLAVAEDIGMLLEQALLLALKCSASSGRSAV